MNEERYGKWTVLSKPSFKWLCECECGKSRLVSKYDLLRGKSTNCGCVKGAKLAAAAKVLCTTHGQTNTPEFRAWTAMKSRCTNTKAESYVNYGARGIVVCERWALSFENFLSDMGLRPSRQYSLDRFPNNNGNYEPGNCRWALPKQQSRNRRTNHLVTHNGVTKTVIEWSELTGIPHRHLLHRLKTKPVSEVLGDAK